MPRGCFVLLHLADDIDTVTTATAESQQRCAALAQVEETAGNKVVHYMKPLS